MSERVGIVFRGDIVPMERTFIDVDLHSACQHFTDVVEEFFMTRGQRVIPSKNITTGLVRIVGFGKDEGYARPTYVSDVVVAFDVDESLTKDDFVRLADAIDDDSPLSGFANLRIRRFRRKDYPEIKTATAQSGS